MAPEFLSTYKTIQPNTLVDIYGCWELWRLVEQTAKREGGIVEVGVWRGGTGALMGKRVREQFQWTDGFLCLKSAIDNNTVEAAYTSHNDLTACAYNGTTCTVTNRDEPRYE